MSVRTLVVGPSWVGDMVMADALFQLLRARDRRVDVLAPGWSLPVLERMDSVENGIEMPLGHGQFGLGARYRLGQQLASQRYDQAIVLPRSFKAALAPCFARIPVRTGYRGEFRFGLINDMRPFDPAVLNQTVKRFLALGLEPDEPLPDTLPRPALRADATNRDAVLTRLQLDPQGQMVALMPGAEYGPAKCWPLEYFRQLGESLLAAGAEVLILGSEKDRPAAAEIAANTAARVLCGETSLSDAIDILSVCRAAVSNDSGLMHVAAAVGCPVVVLYGSTTPEFTPPLTDRASILHLDIECSPCFKRECPLGHFRCMRDIAPPLVLERVQPLLG